MESYKTLNNNPKNFYVKGSLLTVNPVELLSISRSLLIFKSLQNFMSISSVTSANVVKTHSEVAVKIMVKMS